MPVTIQDLKARFTQDKFEVLAVNVDFAEERVEAFLNLVQLRIFHPVRSAGRCFPELEVARLPHDIHPGMGSGSAITMLAISTGSQEIIVDQVKGIR